jgi:hypothetical protein
MDSSGEIAMDGGSGDGQLRCNGQWDGRVIAIGNGKAAAQ